MHSAAAEVLTLTLVLLLTSTLCPLWRAPLQRLPLSPPLFSQCRHRHAPSLSPGPLLPPRAHRSSMHTLMESLSPLLFPIGYQRRSSPSREGLLPI